MRVLFGVLIVLLSSISTASAAGQGGGKIVHLMAHVHDVVIFQLEGEHTNRPACSSHQWALSLTTHTGRAMYAMLLSAQSQGKAVSVLGTGACGAWGDREEPIYMYVNG